MGGMPDVQNLSFILKALAKVEFAKVLISDQHLALRRSPRS